jgi:hypothetical protein
MICKSKKKEVLKVQKCYKKFQKEVFHYHLIFLFIPNITLFQIK